MTMLSVEPAEAVKLLQAGELVVIPTDTVYGLVGDPAVSGIREQIAAAKGRDPNKPIALLVDGPDRLIQYNATPSRTVTQLAKCFWPGPLTIVVDCGSGAEGFRMPDHKVALAILSGCGGVLYATSANPAGEQIGAISAVEAAETLGPQVRHVVVDGTEPGGAASTVVKIVDDEIEILRESAVSKEEIVSCLKN